MHQLQLFEVAASEATSTYNRLTTTDEDGVVADFLVFGGTEEEAKDAAVVVHTYDPEVHGVAMAALTLRQARQLQHLLDTVLGPF